MAAHIYTTDLLAINEIRRSKLGLHLLPQILSKHGTNDSGRSDKVVVDRDDEII